MFEHYLKEYPSENYVTKINLLSKEVEVIHKNDIESNESPTVKFDKNKYDAEWNRLKRFISSYESSNKTLNITFVSTYDCNCRCIYCYENGIVNKDKFKNDDIDTLVDWVTIYLSRNNLKSVSFCFHGGEPLLKPDIIKNVITKLRKKKELDIVFSIVTNGTLLTMDLANELIDLGLKIWQVTLDGIEKTHNSCRPQRQGNSYISAVKTFNYLLKADSVILNINVSERNKNCIYDELSELLECDFIKSNDKIEVRISLVRDLSIKNRKWQVSPKEAADLIIDLSWLLYDRGYKESFYNIQRSSVCTLMLNHSYIINPKSNLSQCISAPDDDHFKCGDIHGVQTFDSIAKKECSNYWHENNECKSCPYVPVCMGRCHLERLINNSGGYKCEQKIFYSYLFDGVLKLELKRRILDLVN